MISQARRRWMLTMGALGLAACDRPSILRSSRDSLPQVLSSEESQEWVVATRDEATVHHVDPDGSLSGLEVELVNRFAQLQNKPVRFIVLSSQAEIRWALYSRRVHFAAAGLLEDSHWKKDARFTAPYRRVTPQIVYNSNLQEKPDDLEDLNDQTLTCLSDSTHAEIVEELRRHGHARIKLQRVSSQIDPLDLLAQVEARKIDYVVADSHQVQLAQQYYPSLAVAFDLGPPRRLCLAFPLGREDKLFQAANQFINKISVNGELARMTEHYFGHLGTLNEQDVRGFLEKRVTLLPRFTDMFKHAQAMTGFDWRLLAALAFQESKWDPLATSPTGVRGIMMLTADTADSLHVSDRLDPKQAIPAASKYLAQLMDSLPVSIDGPDRLWLGLAAYNVGNSHLEDARVLAQRKGLNPSRWVDVKHVLPNLANPEVFPELKFGYARGNEPVNFVDSVRSYYKILQRFEAEYHPPLTSDFSPQPRK